MKQRAHAWVALRALKLIDDSNRKNTELFVELMSYYLSDVWDGVWLPDTLIRDMSYGHIFKMDSDDEFVHNISSQPWNKLTYSELKRETYGKRLSLENYLKDSEELKKPYWITEQSGHLPDRVIALNHSHACMHATCMKHQVQTLQQAIEPETCARVLAKLFTIASSTCLSLHRRSEVQN